MLAFLLAALASSPPPQLDLPPGALDAPPSSEPARAPPRPKLEIRDRAAPARADAETRTSGGFDPYFNPTSRASWSRNGAFSQPSLPSGGSEWVILRDGEAIDDLELALFLDDPALAQRIHDERRDVRRFWRWGFGTAGTLSAVAGGTALALADGRASREVLGGSLLGVAVLCGVMFFLDEPVTQGHVLDRDQAERLVRLYNEKEREAVRTPDRQ